MHAQVDGWRQQHAWLFGLETSRMVSVSNESGVNLVDDVFGGFQDAERFVRDWLARDTSDDSSCTYGPGDVLMVFQAAAPAGCVTLLSGDAALFRGSLFTQALRVSVEVSGQERPLVLYLSRVSGSPRATVCAWVTAALSGGKAVAIYSSGSKQAIVSDRGEWGFFPLQIGGRWYRGAVGSPARLDALEAFLPMLSNDGDRSVLGPQGGSDGSDDLLGAGEHGGVLAVRVQKAPDARDPNQRQKSRLVAACHCVPHAGLLRVVECQENGADGLDMIANWIERALVRSGARELVLQDGDLAEFELHQIDAVAERIGSVARAMMRPKRSAAAALESDLQWLLAQSEDPAAAPGMIGAPEPRSLTLAELQSMRLARDCVSMCLHFLDLRLQIGEKGRFHLERFLWDEHLQLDASALRALHVLQGDDHNVGMPMDAPRGSLFAFLNRCKTPMGMRLLRSTLLEPLRDLGAIENRLDMVELFVEDVIARQRLAESHLKGFADFTLVGRRLAGGKLSLRYLVRLYQSTLRVPALRSELEDLVFAHSSTRPRCCRVLQTEIMDRFAALSASVQEFTNDVERFVDLDRLASHEYVLRPTISGDLSQIRQEMDACLEQIRQLHDETARALTQGEKIRSAASEWLKLERKDGLGHCFRVTRKDEVLIRSQKSLTILETRKDGVRFTTAPLRRWSNAYTAAEQRYEAVQRATLAQVFTHFTKYALPLEAVGRTVAALDLVVAFAIVSAERQLRRPTLNEPCATNGGAGGDLILRGLRHPIVESLLQGERSFVPNDVTLMHPQRLLMITGPNMGGKSVILRSVGLAVLMAHCGCFVAADAASIPLVDRILVRVGAGDIQTRGISTFMAEMLDMATILRHATALSLVLVDELGRGTSTADGFGLAAALCEALAARSSLTLFATHFHELTRLADGPSGNRIQNAHLAVAQLGKKATLEKRSAASRLVFLYELHPGPSEKSFGIHIAEMAGFPPSVIAVAQDKVCALEQARSGMHQRSALSPQNDAA
jgi:DNA mismatch repair protein MSH2